MINNFKKLLLVPLFGLLLTGNAFATVVASSGKTLTGINGLINVTEQNFCGRSGVCGVNSIVDGVEYSLGILDPNSTLAINAFAISTNIMAGVNSIFATRAGWTGQQYSSTAWNSGFGSVGSFSALFGDDGYVNYFSLNPNNFLGDTTSLPGPITTSSDGLFEFFQLLGAPKSSFVALNANNGIVDQSLRTNKVPEPAPLALLGFGLLGIGLLRRRHRS